MTGLLSAFLHHFSRKSYCIKESKVSQWSAVLSSVVKWAEFTAFSNYGGDSVESLGQMICMLSFKLIRRSAIFTAEIGRTNWLFPVFQCHLYLPPAFRFLPCNLLAGCELVMPSESYSFFCLHSIGPGSEPIHIRLINLQKFSPDHQGIWHRVLRKADSELHPDRCSLQVLQ